MADVDDDDFGELYGDVEAQALSAVNGARGFTQLYIDSQQGANSSAIDDFASKDPAPTLVASQLLVDSEGSQRLREGTEAVSALCDKADNMKEGVENEYDGEEENESDSEDDFNIVLNGDDGSPPGALCDGGSQTRGYGEEPDGKVNGTIVNEGEHFAGNCIRDKSGGASSLNQYIKCRGNQKNANWDDAGYIRHNESSLRSASISLLADTGYCFSRPWYRTILDINVDTLENKPWRNPGADMTDFFNFGFNEETWKGYCQNLYELRKKMAIARASSVNEDAGFNQSTESGVRQRFQPVHRKNLPIGSASVAWHLSKYGGNQHGAGVVQIEDGNHERPSSMDVRRPRDQDSDVVIEIIVQEEKEHSSCSDKEKNTVNDDTMPDVSKTTRAGADQKAQSSGSINADDASTCFAKGKIQSPCTPSVNKRQYVSESARSPTVLGPDTKRNERCTELNAASEEYFEERNVSVDDNDKSTSETNPCLMKLDLSLDDNNGCLSSPSAESEFEGSLHDGGCAHKRRWKDRRSSLANSLEKLDHTPESEFSFSRHHGRDDINLKASNSRYSPRDRSPLEKKRKHRYQRHPLHEKWKIWDSGGRGIDAADCNPREDYLPEKRQLTNGHHKRSKHVHGLAYSDEDFPYDGEEEYLHPFDHKRVPDNRNRVDNPRDSRRRTHRSIRYDEDPYLRREFDRRDLDDRRVNHHVVDKIGRRDGHHRDDKFLYDEDLSSFTLPNGHCVGEGKINAWGGYEDMHFNRRQKVDSLLESRYADDLIFDKLGGADPLYIGEVDYIERKHGQLSPQSGKERSIRGRVNSCGESQSFNYQYSCSREDDDAYWIRKKSMHDNPEFTDRRHDIVRQTHDIKDYRLMNRDGRHHRNVFGMGHGDGCYHGPDDAFDSYDAMRYHDVELYDEGSYDPQPDAFDWRGSDFVQAKYDELHDKDISFHSVSRSECGTGRLRFLHHRMSNNRQIVKYESRTVRGSDELHGINSEALRRGKRGVSGFKSRDSAGLHSVVKERKSSGGSSKARTAVCSDLRDTLRRRNQKRGSHLSGKSCPKRTAKAAILHTERFPRRRDGDGSDLEEGQLPAEKNNKKKMQKNHPLKRKHAQERNSDDIKDGAYSENWILETKAKMEKRRERFKESVSEKKESDSYVNSSVDKLVETDQQNLQRPARKRRWVGS